MAPSAPYANRLLTPPHVERLALSDVERPDFRTAAIVLDHAADVLAANERVAVGEALHRVRVLDDRERLDFLALGVELADAVAVEVGHHHVAVGQDVDAAEEDRYLADVERLEDVLGPRVDADVSADVGDEGHVAVAQLLGAEDVVPRAIELEDDLAGAVQLEEHVLHDDEVVAVWHPLHADGVATDAL